MATGSVTFHSNRLVKRLLVRDRENAIVNLLNKTKKEVHVDHEAVRIERERTKGREKKAQAVQEVRATKGLQRTDRKDLR